MWKRYLAGITATATLGAGGVTVADRQANPYTDKGAHYELPIKADIPQGERVEIAKDKAELTLKGWNDEYAIKITPQIPTASLGAIDRPFTTPADRKLISKKMEYRSGDVTAFIEPKEGTENEFDIDFTLHAKPDTNVFTYKIEGAEEFDFFYQPELTPEEIADGAKRPENVVGSYAVYHKTKAHYCTNCNSPNYATGKVFHIFRPKVIDANGVEAWAQLDYSNGQLTVTVSQTFLDNALFPVIVDPTFGQTSIGASFGAFGTSRALTKTGYRYTASSGDTITGYSIYGQTSGSSRDENVAAYTFSGGIPVTRLGSAQIITFTPSAAGWFSITGLSESLTGGVEYVVAFAANSAMNNYYDAGTTAMHTQTSLTLSTTWTNLGTSVNLNSIYATYTAGGGAVDDTRPPDDAFFD